MVPPKFTWRTFLASPGDFEVIQARWATNSGLKSLKQLVNFLIFRISIFLKTALGLRFFRLPLERSSITSTLKFLAIRQSTKCEPINPAPPVTITLTSFITGIIWRNEFFCLGPAMVYFFPRIKMAERVGQAGIVLRTEKRVVFRIAMGLLNGHPTG